MSVATEYKPKKWTYGVHPSVKMMQDWIASLPAKTGRSLQQWIDLTRKQGGKTEDQRRDWLKRQHQFGTNAAWTIAQRASGRGGDEDDDPESYLRSAQVYVEEMFAGRKASLRPIFDALMAEAHALGRDVRACPCTTMVPLYRNHVFAQIKPTTNTRIDLGLCLRGVKPTKRLLSTGGEAKGDRITHRIAISAVEEIDDELRKCLKRAHETDAE
jgi:hypothetical protein